MWASTLLHSISMLIFEPLSLSAKQTLILQWSQTCSYPTNLNTDPCHFAIRESPFETISSVLSRTPGTPQASLMRSWRRSWPGEDSGVAQHSWRVTRTFGSWKIRVNFRFSKIARHLARLIEFVIACVRRLKDWPQLRFDWMLEIKSTNLAFSWSGNFRRLIPLPEETKLSTNWN